MQLHEQLKKPNLADKLAKIIVRMDIIEMWLFVYGFVLFGIVVTIWRELKRVG